MRAKTKPELSENAITVLERRYLAKDGQGQVVESPEELFERVAANIASAEALYGQDADVQTWAERFYELMANLEFLPNSPTLMNAGRDLQQLSACFVLPVEDSMESIFEAIKNTALIHKSGGGTGFSFSRLRPKDDRVLSTGGVASGPVSFMRVFNAATDAVKQGGTRRGANMAILAVDHPDIIEFITVKRDRQSLTNFNLSVAVTDSFMQAVMAGEDYDLVNPRTGEVSARLPARKVFDLIVDMAWDNGEPGVVFIDRINAANPTPKLGRIESTNPCVAGDTLIYTTGGLRRARDLWLEQADPAVVVDGRRSAEPLLAASTVIRTGVKPVYRLTTQEGYELRLTADHRVMTDRGWVEAGQLVDGDKVHILNRKGGFGSGGSRDLGLVLGWLVGDGTLSSERAILAFFGSEKQELAPAFATLVDAEVEGLQRGSRGYSVRSAAIKGRDEARVRSARLLRIAEEHGLKPGDKHRVPDSVLSGSEEMQRGFLQALFTADGHISGCPDRGISVRLTSTSRQLLLDVQRLLLNFGIASVIYSERRAEGMRELPDGKGGRRAYLCQAYHDLAVAKDNLARFAYEIGFLSEAKQQALLAQLAAYRRGPYREDFKATFSGLIPEGEEDVFDLVEPITHSFVANGVVVHNCGEQPLLPYEACNLGSINLAKMVKVVNGRREVDYERLADTVQVAVRFLDDVIDVNRYPLPIIAEKTRGNRKIGLGVMGFADLLICLSIPYDSAEALKLGEGLMRFIQSHAREASAQLAVERGPFPNFRESVYYEQGHKPLRNATTTTIAPTGTLSIIANCSSGIEPIFAVAYFRNILDNDRLVEVHSGFEAVAREGGFYSEDLMRAIAAEGTVRGQKDVPLAVQRLFVSAHDVTPEWHVRMQAAFQHHTDNAVSKTVNLGREASKDDVRRVLIMAYEEGCKGITLYRDGSREGQVLSKGDSNGKEEKRDAGRIVPRTRPQITYGTTEKMTTGCGNLYVTVNADDKGICEVFSQMGKSGGCAQAQSEAVSRLISLALRSGVDIESIVKQLKGIRCPSIAWREGGVILSCPDAISKVLEARLRNGRTSEIITKALENRSLEAGPRNLVGQCPDCSSLLEYLDGCFVCRACGYSKCG